jgi:hypothetical protein
MLAIRPGIEHRFRASFAQVLRVSADYNALVAAIRRARAWWKAA